MAVVKLNDKYGYVDKSGKEIVPPKYNWVGKFSEGIVSVLLGDPNSQGKRYGLFNKEGNMIAEPKYTTVGDFSDGLILVGTGDKSYGYKYGYIDKTGKEVIPLQYSYATYFSEGLAIVGVDGEYKIIDRTGKIVAAIKDKIRTASYGAFVDGMAMALSTGTTAGSIYGFIDKTGKTIVPYKYSQVENFRNGFARVWRGNDCGIIDKTGKEIIPTMYGNVKDFNDGVSIARGHYSNNSPNWICAFDKTGKEVVKGGAYSSIGTFSDGLSWVTSGYTTNTRDTKQIGIIDTTGKQVVKTGKYISIGNFIDGIAIVNVYLGENGTYNPDKYRWGAIDKTGKEVIPATRTYAIENFNNGLALIKSNNKYGFIDTKGNVVLPPSLKYDSIISITEKMYKVELNGKWGVLTVKKNL